MAPSVRIDAIELFERGVVLRLPFRFGVVTLTACPQAFVRVHVTVGGRRKGIGATAELLAPKWFDKNLALTNEDNFEQLRQALRLARDAYLSDATPRSAFGHAAAHYNAHLAACAGQGLNPLIASFGTALVDRAVLDAMGRAEGVSFAGAINANLPGIDARLTPDLDGFALDAFLAGLRPAPGIAARHTVGLVDAIVAADVSVRVNDGLPETLEEVVNVYGNRYFKLKVSGDADADIDRLSRIAAVLERLPDYAVTLDGNEQFGSVAEASAFWNRVGRSAPNTWLRLWPAASSTRSVAR